MLIRASLSKAWGRSLNASNLTLQWYEDVLFKQPYTALSIQNTLLFSTRAAISAMVIGVAIAYVVNHKLVPGWRFLEFLAMVPLVIPGIVIAIGIFSAYSRPPLVLYGTGRQFGELSPRLPTQTDVNIALGEIPYDSPPWDIDSSPSHRNRLEGSLAPGRPNLDVAPIITPDGRLINPDGSPIIIPEGGVVTELDGQVHAWIGGDMVLVGVSPNDPVFFLHHANVVGLWATWQDKNPTQGYQPTGDGPDGHNLYDLMYPWDGETVKLKAKPADVLDSRKIGIYYG